MDELHFYSMSLTSSLHDLISRIEKGSLDLTPPFKKNTSWKKDKKISFIESMLLGIPSQPLWLEENFTGGLTLIDGAQRLQAAKDFIYGKYALSNLTINTDYNNKYYHDLPYKEMLTLERYPFQVNIVKYNNNPSLKLAFFKNINGGSKCFSYPKARNFAFPNAHRLFLRIQRNISPLNIFSTTDFYQSDESDEAFSFLLLITLHFEGLIKIKPNTPINHCIDNALNFYEQQTSKDNSMLLVRQKMEYTLNDMLNHSPPFIHDKKSLMSNKRHRKLLAMEIINSFTLMYPKEFKPKIQNQNYNTIEYPFPKKFMGKDIIDYLWRLQNA